MLKSDILNELPMFLLTLFQLRAVGLYHDLNSKDLQQAFRSLVEPLPPVEQATHMPIQVNEIFIAPDIEILAENYVVLHDLPTLQMDTANLSVENISPTHIPPHLEHNLMSLPEFTLDKVVKLQKKDTFCKNTLEHIHCSKQNSYFIDAMGILHRGYQFQ